MYFNSQSILMSNFKNTPASSVLFEFVMMLNWLKCENNTKSFHFSRFFSEISFTFRFYLDEKIRTQCRVVKWWHGIFWHFRAYWHFAQVYYVLIHCIYSHWNTLAYFHYTNETFCVFFLEKINFRIKNLI